VEHEFTLTGKIKRPDVEQLCEWIREAWAHILPALIEKSFKKCGISNKLNDTEDDYLRNSDPDHASSVDEDDDESSREEYP
jgi:3-methyladenine DNA glycosylase AlkC